MRARSTGLISAAALATAMSATGALGQDLFASPYLEFGGGLNSLSADLTNIDSDEIGPETSTLIDPMALGGTAYAAFGTSPMPGLRLALETNITNNTGARFNVQAEGSGTLLVDAMTFSVLAQIWKDFEISDMISLHIGGGLGAGLIVASTTDDTPTTTTTTVPGLAYMAGFGADVDLGDGMILTLNYSLSGIGSGSVGTVPIETNDATETVTGDVSLSPKHAVTIGVRIPFGS